jgi:hypothetical protein
MPHHSLTMQGLHNCVEKNMRPWILLLQLLVTPCRPQSQSSWTPHLMIDVAMDSPYWEEVNVCVFWCLITVSICKGRIIAWKKYVTLNFATATTSHSLLTPATKFLDPSSNDWCCNGFSILGGKEWVWLLMPYYSLIIQGLHNCMEKNMRPWILLLQLLVTSCWPQPHSSWTPHLMIDAAMDSILKGSEWVFFLMPHHSLTMQGLQIAWRKICDPEFCYCNY